MTNPLFSNQVSLSRARAELGPLVRWVAARRARIAVTSRGDVSAVLISVGELLDLEQQADRRQRSTMPENGKGTSA